MRESVGIELTRRGVLVGTAATVATTTVPPGAYAQDAANPDAPGYSHTACWMITGGKRWRA